MNTIAEKYFGNKQNLSTLVVEYIKESILSGLYKEGDHLLETEIASTLGISRAPIREAIKELEKEGIVQTIPRKGTFVTRFSVEDIKEVFDIRMLLENNIFKMLIYEKKLDIRDFSHLEHLVNEMNNIAQSNMEYNQKSILINLKDMEFHRYLWNRSGSKRRVEILESIFFQLRMAMLYDTNETGDLTRTATDHYKIIDALKSMDIVKCKKALEDHIITYNDNSLLD